MTHAPHPASSPLRRLARFAGHWLPIPLLAVPPAFLLYCLWRFALNMPYWDAWSMVPFLQEAHERRLAFANFFIQHNESRLAFSRLVLLAIEYVSDWNVYWEIAALLLLATATLAILAWQSERAHRLVADRPARWHWVAMAALVFSVVQYECWANGFTLIGYLNVFFTVAGLFLLGTPPFSPARAGLAFILGVLATFSYVNGVLFWPAGVVALLALAWEERRFRPLPLLVWVAGAAFVLAAYFHGYTRPAHHPPMLQMLKDPLGLLHYLLLFFASPIVNIPPFRMYTWLHQIMTRADGTVFQFYWHPLFDPATLGLIGLGLFAVGGLYGLWQAGRRVHRIGPWLALGAYALLSGLAAATGRSLMGPDQAQSSRYTALSDLLWIAGLVLVGLMVRDLGQRFRSRRATFTLGFVRWGLAGFALVCARAWCVSSYFNLIAWEQRTLHLEPARNELLTDLPDERFVTRAFPSTLQMREWLPILTHYNLTIFREKKPFAAYRPTALPGGAIDTLQTDLLSRLVLTQPPPDRAVGAADGAPRTARVLTDGYLTLTGRAFDPERRRPARAVLCVDPQGRIIARAGVEPDRAAPHDYRRTVWRHVLPAKKLGPDRTLLTFYALCHDNVRVAPLGTLAVTPVPTDALRALCRLTFEDFPAIRVGAIDKTYFDHSGKFVVGDGWARDPDTELRGRWVIVTDQHTNILTFAETGEERTDVAFLYDTHRLLHCGLRYTFSADRLLPEGSTLRAYLLQPERGRALRLSNEFHMVRTK